MPSASVSARNVVMLWVISFVLVAIGNAVTHGPLGGKFMTESLALLAPPSGGINTGIWIGIVWAMIASATVYFALREREPTPRRIAVVGAWVGLLVDGSWNFINEANYSQWSNTLIVLDVAWHVVHGAAVGAIVGWLMRRFARANSA
ncbi:MAG TPA: DUF2177 family protein [Myxococcaceae bacterium]|nr:DUF2177 family protein [Myxococcaceae bacterium]